MMVEDMEEQREPSFEEFSDSDHETLTDNDDDEERAAPEKQHTSTTTMTTMMRAKRMI